LIHSQSEATFDRSPYPETTLGLIILRCLADDPSKVGQAVQQFKQIDRIQNGSKTLDNTGAPDSNVRFLCHR
jgi:hypothetical protein